MYEDSYVTRRRSIGLRVDDIVDVDSGGRGEEGVSEARERLAVKAPVPLLSYTVSVVLTCIVSRRSVPASSAFFSSSVSLGWKTPFFHATVTQVNARLKSPKPSLKTNQAKLASLLLGFFVVRAGEGGIVDDCCHSTGWGVRKNFEIVRVAVWGRSRRGNGDQQTHS